MHERGELSCGALGPVDEAERADGEREQRDEREEDLVGNAAREEAAVVIAESQGDAAGAPCPAG